MTHISVVKSTQTVQRGVLPRMVVHFIHTLAALSRGVRVGSLQVAHGAT